MFEPAKIYRRLLALYPARFREEYQGPMERQFLDEYQDASTWWEKARVCLSAAWDFAATAPRQFVSELSADLRYGLRGYRRRSLSVALAVIALGLAIGASTGVFSVLNALLLRTLPFSRPEQLLELWLAPVSAMSGRTAFKDWYRRSPYLQSVAAFSSSEMNLTTGGNAFRVSVAETSADFFSLLGVKAAAGRTFAGDEDILGRNAVAVIGYGVWQEFFGGDPDVTGKSLLLNGARLTIIGVAPQAFDYPGKTAIWIPTVFDFEKIPKRGAFLFQTIGRLKPGITLRSAQGIFESEARRAQSERSRSLSIDEQNRPHLISLQNQLAGPMRQASWALAGMTLLVLLTACANVAHVLLSRATERRQELAVRAALGASRARLVQQLITEATFLTVTGAVLGLLVAHWVCQIASSIVPAQLATQQYTILDWRVLGFAIGVAVVTGVTFGVAPALFLGRLQSFGSTVRNHPGTRDPGTKRAQSGLIALQAALTLCLVISSLELGRTFLKLLDTHLGFQTSGVLTLKVSLEGTRQRGSEWRYYNDVLDRLRAQPWVEAAGAVSYLPLANNIYMAEQFKLDSGQSLHGVVMNAVTPGYFRAMGMQFLQGSDFAQDAGSNSEHPVLVNQAFAQAARLENAIVGRRLIAPWTRVPYVIKGIVSTTRFGGPAAPGGAQIYWPVRGEPPSVLTFAAKVRGTPGAFLGPARDTVRLVDPKVPIYDVKTLKQRLSDVLARPRIYTIATFFLAVIAISLAAVGVYGTAAYSIAQRRHEMGVRMAFGASYSRVRTMVVRQNMMPVLVGAGAGIVLAIWSGHFLQHLLTDATRPAFWIFLTATGFLLLMALSAGWTATASALSIDPVESLRAE